MSGGARKAPGENIARGGQQHRGSNGNDVWCNHADLSLRHDCRFIVHIRGADMSVNKTIKRTI